MHTVGTSTSNVPSLQYIPAPNPDLIYLGMPFKQHGYVIVNLKLFPPVFLQYGQHVDIDILRIFDQSISLPIKDLNCEQEVNLPKEDRNFIKRSLKPLTSTAPNDGLSSELMKSCIAIMQEHPPIEKPSADKKAMESQWNQIFDQKLVPILNRDPTKAQNQFSKLLVCVWRGVCSKEYQGVLSNHEPLLSETGRQILEPPNMRQEIGVVNWTNLIRQWRVNIHALYYLQRNPAALQKISAAAKLFIVPIGQTSVAPPTATQQTGLQNADTPKPEEKLCFDLGRLKTHHVAQTPAYPIDMESFQFLLKNNTTTQENTT